MGEDKIMADISKCNGKDCDIKDDCYRYTADAHINQSWVEPHETGGDCEMYYPNGNKGRELRKKYGIGVENE